MWFKGFGKKRVTFLGRGGVIFEYQDLHYIVDSEVAFSHDVDIVIYKDSLKFKEKKQEMNAEQKEEVLNALIECLKQEENLTVKVFWCLKE